MADAADPILLHAAGSLRGALNEVAAAYEKSTGLKVTAKYGASGTLREEIGRGEKAEVFASANMEHPLALAKDGQERPGGAVRAQPAVRAGAVGTDGCADEPA